MKVGSTGDRQEDVAIGDPKRRGERLFLTRCGRGWVWVGGCRGVGLVLLKVAYLD